LVCPSGTSSSCGTNKISSLEGGIGITDYSTPD
jgi:hypothetical protein